MRLNKKKKKNERINTLLTFHLNDQLKQHFSFFLQTLLHKLEFDDCCFTSLQRKLKKKILKQEIKT